MIVDNGELPPLDETVLSPNNDESEKGFMLHGNRVAQHFVQRVYKYFETSHPDKNMITETSMVLKISVITVCKQKDGPSNSKVTPIPKIDDIRQCVKETIQLEIYEMYRESLFNIKCSYDYIYLTSRQSGIFSKSRFLTSVLFYEILHN